MARRKSKKRTKRVFVTVIVLIILVILGVLIANSVMDGKLLKNLKIADEKKAEEKKQLEENKNQETKNEDEKTDVKTEDKKDENIFTKKEDETSFKLVDKTTDEEKPSTSTPSETKKQTEEKRELALKVAKNEWFGGEEPKSPKEYFDIIEEKSDNIFVVEVRDKETTRVKIKYEINVFKKEIVERY